MSNFRFYAKGGKTTILKTGGKLVEKDIEVLGDPSGSLDEYLSKTLKRVVISTPSLVLSEGLFSGQTSLEYVEFSSDKAPYLLVPRVFENCSALRIIVFRGTDKACDLEDGAFDEVLNTDESRRVNVYVPRALKTTYEDYWDSSIPTHIYFYDLEDYTVDGTIWGELDPAKI